MVRQFSQKFQVKSLKDISSLNFTCTTNLSFYQTLSVIIRISYIPSRNFWNFFQSEIYMVMHKKNLSNSLIMGLYKNISSIWCVETTTQHHNCMSTGCSTFPFASFTSISIFQTHTCNRPRQTDRLYFLAFSPKKRVFVWKTFQKHPCTELQTVIEGTVSPRENF